VSRTGPVLVTGMLLSGMSWHDEMTGAVQRGCSQTNEVLPFMVLVRLLG